MRAISRVSDGADFDMTADCLLCTSVTAQTTHGMEREMAEAVEAGAQIIELRLDFLANLNPARDLPKLVAACPVPAIVTFRPKWEGGHCEWPEDERLAVLAMAASMGVAFVDIELKAADKFFALRVRGRSPTKFIVSSHDFEKTLPTEELLGIATRGWEVGADVVKIANMAQDITEVRNVYDMIQAQEGKGPCIGLSMSECGQMSRILAPKFGSMLTFGALSQGKESAPGQPSLSSLAGMYRLGQQTRDTPVFGVIGNPVAHSRSPALHNAALAATSSEGCYVPLLVHHLEPFLRAFDMPTFQGYSVTIPHKEAALRCCKEVDPVAARIGAVNTLVRQPDGSLKGYNTDWLAAIEAIEQGLGGGEGALAGRRVVVLGAGGAGRALAFGALARGAASVVIANRSLDRAQALAEAVGCEAAALEEVAAGKVRGDVLANTTAVGMHPHDNASPVPAEALPAFSLVFDAVYTPLETVLLKEAAAAGCVVVSGLEMFVGQAAAQFKLFTGKEAPLDVMRQSVLDSIKEQ